MRSEKWHTTAELLTCTFFCKRHMRSDVTKHFALRKSSPLWTRLSTLPSRSAMLRITLVRCLHHNDIQSREHDSRVGDGKLEEGLCPSQPKSSKGVAASRPVSDKLILGSCRSFSNRLCLVDRYSPYDNGHSRHSHSHEYMYTQYIRLRRSTSFA